MDRKGIIGLLICGILFAAHIHYSGVEAQRKADIAQKERAEKKKEEAEKAKEGGEAVASIEESPANDANTEEPAANDVPEQEVRLETEKVTFVLTNKGGGIKYAEFKEQDAVVISSERKKLSDEQKANPELVHLNRFGDSAVGALVKGGVDQSLDLTYVISNPTKESVTFGARTPSGLIIAKTWTLVPVTNEATEYRIDLKVTVKNSNESGSISLKDYGIHAGSAGPLYKGEDLRGTGFFVYDGKLQFKGTNWFGKGIVRGPRPRFEEEFSDVLYAGVSNQFFATMVGKKKDTDATVWAMAPEKELEKNGGGSKKRFVSMAWSLPDEKLGPDESGKFEYEIFMGPKDNKIVRQLGKGRGKLMHYGFFSFISHPLNMLLNFYHDKVFVKPAGKLAWGFAIILVTFTIRLVIWPLHNASTRTMKRMSKLQPMMAELKEKYPDDPQKVQTETMKLYKEYEINPVGGCLPMFAQIPIFFGFYKMLRSAVELRGAEFMWVKDLALPDTVTELPLPFLEGPVPVNLLPFLMVITMFFQMRMTPQTGDPMQRRIFMLMPFMFFFFCYNFASALALYWTAQNIFSIGQTWWTQRQPEVEMKKRKTGKKGFMEKMAAKAEEAQKMQAQMKAAKGAQGGQGQPAKPKKPRGPKTGG